jgi:hypothetical protein
MFFSNAELDEFRVELATITGRYGRLVQAYVERDYIDERAREFAIQAFSRRLKTLVRCVENVFDIFPPDCVDLPTRDDLIDGAINIQTFVFNVFGSTDNLAWIWVREKNVTLENGSPIQPRWVGLGERHDVVRRSFSAQFQMYLDGLNGWFAQLENFRHALAHRVPLYIPPHVVDRERLDAYEALDAAMSDALRRHDNDEHDRLAVEQEALVEFRPIMTHSFGENADYVAFHRRILTDFNTIEELGIRLLEELDL